MMEQTRLSGVSALIPAAGRGERLGSGVNKCFVEIAGKPILAHTLDVFETCGAVDEIVLVVGEREIEAAGELVGRCGFSKVASIVAGGAQRQDSVANGLAHVTREIVAIHDGARPLVTHAAIEESIAKAREMGACVAAVGVIDTIKSASSDGIVSGTLDRRDLFAVQTPQTFRTELIRRACDLAMSVGYYATDDAALVEKIGEQVAIVEGSRENIKITTPADLQFASAMLGDHVILSRVEGSAPSIPDVSGHPCPETEQQARNVSGHPCPETEQQAPNVSGHPCPETEQQARNVSGHPCLETGRAEVRTGIGIDVHALIEGRKLVLGGVEIEHDKGLAGHSDADVICHAIADALLGAAALGDIGRHFPDSEAAYKGISSLKLLALVAELLAREGWRVVNVDAMLACERPRIAPHIPEMTRRIAECLGIEPSRVGVKATTTEGLGFTGREEGMACFAVATLARRLCP